MNEASPQKLTALVTGASSGIGKAVALRLARDGYHVLIHYQNNRAGADDALSTVTKNGGSAEIVQFDVKDKTAIETALETLFPGGAGRSPDVLVNNAGIHRDNLTGMMSDSQFNEVMQTNAYGPFYLMRWCVKQMIRRRSGCIVNISSLAGQTGNAGQLNYAASKAALIAMTRSLSAEVGARGIRVNAVAPGLIETDMIKDIPQLENFTTRIPLKRLGRPEEVAGAVSFLCSGDASYITGHTISVNGGLFPS